MYDSTKQYVDKDAYLEFAGIDLDIELKNSNYDNTTSKTNIFPKKTTGNILSALLKS